MSQSKDIVIRQGSSNWHFTLWDSADDNRRQLGRWSSTAPDQGDTRETWQQKLKLTFSAKKQTISLNEKWCEVVSGQAAVDRFVAGNLNISALSCRVLHFRAIVVHGERENSFEIILQMLDGKSMSPISYDVSNRRYEQRQALLEFKRVDQADLLPKARVIRILIGSYRENRFFDPLAINNILRGDFKETPLVAAMTFIGNQKLALQAEAKHREDELDDLVRKDCVAKVNVVEHAGKVRLELSVTPASNEHTWKMEIGMKVGLVATTFLTKDAPAPDAAGYSGWTARVMTVSSTGGYTARILNPVTEDDVRNWDSQTIRGVTSSVLDEDVMADRLSTAVKKMETCLRNELDPSRANSPRDPEDVVLRVPAHRLFVQHDEIRSVDWPIVSVSLKNNATQLRYEDSWSLEDSHKRVIESAINSRGGIVPVRGPPGTGKTTVIAKVAAILVSQADLDGKIVLSAHSNVATHVLLDKCFRIFPLFGLKPEDHIVLVETAAAVQRRRHGNETETAGLEACSLEPQLLALAKTDTEKYKDYLRFSGPKARNETLSLADVRKLERSRAVLCCDLQQARSVFICTISTMNTNFFVRQHVKGGPKFSCAVWVCDEASQVPVPAFMEGWLKHNPRVVIIGGDKSQLQPYAGSQPAQAIWKKSPISYGQDLGETMCVLLDVQYRMAWHLFEPTNALHYEGRIRPHHSTVNRPYDVELLQKISRIQIKPSSKGVWQSLNHSYVVFDVVDGETTTWAATSSRNLIEAQVVERFLPVLQSAGVSWSDIMAMTPYQGQWKTLQDWQHHNDGSGDMQVRKIDSSQGGEKPVVVFSLVKTKELGFCGSRQRQNVATSRQQSAFFFFGKTAVFRQKTVWKEWSDVVWAVNTGRASYFTVDKNCEFRLAPRDAPAVVLRPLPQPTSGRAPTTPSAPFLAPPRPSAARAAPVATGSEKLLSSPVDFMTAAETSVATRPDAVPVSPSALGSSLVAGSFTQPPPPTTVASLEKSLEAASLSTPPSPSATASTEKPLVLVSLPDEHATLFNEAQVESMEDMNPYEQEVHTARRHMMELNVPDSRESAELSAALRHAGRMMSMDQLLAIVNLNCAEMSYEDWKVDKW